MKIKLTPAIQAEREAVINALRPVVPMLAAMAGPHLEVVLHDVARPEGSVVAIANGHISGRAVGSSVLEGPHGDRGFAAAMEQMLAPLRQAALAPQAAPANAQQMDTLMQEIIGDAMSLATMKREEKIQAVCEMQRRGLFIVKGGVQRAAAALQVSRFTIYNYVEELRRREQDGKSS